MGYKRCWRFRNEYYGAVVGRFYTAHYHLNNDSTPIAWWSMNKWVSDYNYKISISWWIFLEKGIISIIIAPFTVSFQAIRAALLNPVQSLRSE